MRPLRACLTFSQSLSSACHAGKWLIQACFVQSDAFAKIGVAKISATRWSAGPWTESVGDKLRENASLSKEAPSCPSPISSVRTFWKFLDVLGVVQAIERAILEEELDTPLMAPIRSAVGWRQREVRRSAEFSFAAPLAFSKDGDACGLRVVQNGLKVGIRNIGGKGCDSCRVHCGDL